jgi:hypothetical protein
MRGHVFHLKGKVTQSAIAFLPGRRAVFAVIVEQFQAGTVRQGKVGDIKVAAVDGLELLESENATVEIQRFPDIGAVDGNVVDRTYLQGVVSNECKESCPSFCLDSSMV